MRGSTLAELRNYVALHNMKDDSILLGIFSKSDDAHLGNIKFEPINFEERTAVIGVLIGNVEWRGSNVFGEAFSSAKLFLSEKYGISKFLLGVQASNTPAIKAYQKAGFEKVGEKFGGSSVIMSCTTNLSPIGVSLSE